IEVESEVRLEMGFSEELGPVEPRHASTVILLRETLSGPEAYVQGRASTMAACAGGTVVAGGGVDARGMLGVVDHDGVVSSDVAWSGPDVRWWAHRLRKDPAIARALVCAAVRETFEEAGTLLASNEDGDIVADTTRFQHERQELENHL